MGFGMEMGMEMGMENRTELMGPAQRARRAQGARWLFPSDGSDEEWAFVDQGDTGHQPAADAVAPGRRLEEAKLPETERGFVLLPRRWAVERSNAWGAPFRPLALWAAALAGTRPAARLLAERGLARPGRRRVGRRTACAGLRAVLGRCGEPVHYVLGGGFGVAALVRGRAPWRAAVTLP